MPRLTDIAERSAEILTEIDELKQNVDSWTPEQESRFEALCDEHETLQGQREKLDKRRELLAKFDQPAQPQRDQRAWPAGLPEYFDNGRRLEVCTRDHASPLLDTNYRFANWLKAWATKDTGHFSDVEQRASFDTSSALTPEEWDRNFTELLRANLALVAAGAEMVFIGTKTVNMTRVSALPTTAFAAELAAVSPAEGTLAAVVGTPERVSNLQNASREFLSDTPGGAEALEQVAAQGVAEAVDAAGLHGAANGPTGLESTSGIQTLTAASGGSVSWTEISADIAEMLGVDTQLDRLSLIMNPADMADLDVEQDSNGAWLGPSAWAQRIKLIPSTSVTAGKYFLGDFSYATVVTRLGTEIEWFPSGVSGSVNLIHSNASALRLTSRVDVVFRQPGAFGMGTISA